MGTPARARSAAGVSFLLCALLMARTDALLPGHPDFLRPWDHQKYLAMAEAPLELRIAPFSWRLLGPSLARVLPFDLPVAFRLLSFLGVWLSAVALFVLVRRLRPRPVDAWVGMLSFLSLGWATGYLFYNLWLPDGLAFLLLVLAAVAAVERRPLCFAALLVVGALTKEQVLLAAPLWYRLSVGSLPGWRRLGRMVALAAPALAVTAAVRLALPAGNTDPAHLAEAGPLNRWDRLPVDPASLLATFARPRLAEYPVLALDWTLGAFGVLALLALAAPRPNLRIAARWSPFLALVYAQPLLASNTKRLVVLAFPVFVLMAMEGLAALQRRLSLPDAALVAVPASLVVADLVWLDNAVSIGPEIVLVTAIVAGAHLVGSGPWRSSSSPTRHGSTTVS